MLSSAGWERASSNRVGLTSLVRVSDVAVPTEPAIHGQPTDGARDGLCGPLCPHGALCGHLPTGCAVFALPLPRLCPARPAFCLAPHLRQPPTSPAPACKYFALGLSLTQGLYIIQGLYITGAIADTSGCV